MIPRLKEFSTDKIQAELCDGCYMWKLTALKKIEEGESFTLPPHIVTNVCGCTPPEKEEKPVVVEPEEDKEDDKRFELKAKERREEIHKHIDEQKKKNRISRFGKGGKR